MEVFRLAKRKYSSPLTGRGAALVGGRWNSKGFEMIYTAESRALAMAEVLPHLPLAALPEDFVMMKIWIPEVEFDEISTDSLPVNWNTFPFSNLTQRLGDKFLVDNQYLLLKAPSVVVPGDYNWLINPMHSEFSKVKVTELVDFPFDKRLFK